MYLKKIIKLQNIGKFHQGGVSGGEYGKVTLIYAGNGRGKTTLCAVLRSLKTGSPTPIHDRRTLGELAQPHAQLLLDSGTAAFTNGKWNVPCDALHIFDGTFITENVHTGEEVSTDNRRSLYRVIVGTKGVVLAEEVDDLDAKVSEITVQLATEKKVLQQHIAGGMSFDTFLGLPDDPQIDQKIATQQQKIAAATKAAEIAGKPLLKPQAIPGLPSALLASLKKTVSGVSADAASKLEQHLSKHEFGLEGEDWVATGLQHVRQDSCPLCGNAVKGNVLPPIIK